MEAAYHKEMLGLRENFRRISADLESLTLIVIERATLTIMALLVSGPSTE